MNGNNSNTCIPTGIEAQPRQRQRQPTVTSSNCLAVNEITWVRTPPQAGLNDPGIDNAGFRAKAKSL